MVRTLASEGKEREGSLTVIGAVSPPGGDLSEPVSQATLRVTKTFWSLDSGLAYKKHFPSINWLVSYSLYVDNFTDFWATEIAPDFAENRALAMTLLEQESSLLEIVRLVGMESLSASDRLVLEVSRMIREDYLFQDAFSPDDAYTPLDRQYGMLKSILTFYTAGKDVVTAEEFDFTQFTNLSTAGRVATLKDQLEWKIADFEAFQDEIKAEVTSLKTTTN
jgi:V/A-type H+-transporting ATPase subunit A